MIAGKNVFGKTNVFFEVFKRKLESQQLKYKVRPLLVLDGVVQLMSS